MTATVPGWARRFPAGSWAAPWALLMVLLCLGGCKQSPAPAVRPPAAPASVPVDPIMARVDLTDVRLSQVQARLGESAQPEPQQIAHALLGAVSDTLVLRELAVLEHRPKAGETAHAAAARFLAGIWPTDDGCPNLSKDALRMAWMETRGRLHHPSRMTIWEGQFVCCTSPATCDPASANACKARLHPSAQALHERIDAGLPSATGLAAGVTMIALDLSPLASSHGAVAEMAIAELSGEVTELRLRRYTFHGQNEPGFAGARLVPTEPEVEAAARQAALGAAVGPIETVWGWSVFVLVAREPAQRAAFGDPAVRQRLRQEVCSKLVETERLAYRKRLLAGARLQWRRSAIEAAFGPAVVGALAPDASAREPPHVPEL